MAVEMEIIDYYIADTWTCEVSIYGILLEYWCDIVKISRYGLGE